MFRSIFDTTLRSTVQRLLNGRRGPGRWKGDVALMPTAAVDFEYHTDDFAGSRVLVTGDRAFWAPESPVH